MNKPGRGARVLLWSSAFVGALLLAGLAWIALPVPAGILAAGNESSLTIVDRNGLTLRRTRASDGSLARWIPLGRMDPDLLVAFVALEDRRFYGHHGVDVRSALRAVRDNLRRRRVVSGASTITMQLARLLRPIDRSATGKIEQALWALRLDAHLTKQQILEQYLNRVPLGQGSIGVAAAASLYFNTSVSRVSLGQAALLAGLAHAPSSQNPLVSLPRARARRAVALGRLQALGFVSNAERLRASEEPLLSPDRGRPFLAPHFTTQLLRWAETDGRPLDGVWRTSLDLELQTALEAEVRHTVDQLRDRGGKQAAVVVLDNTNGEVLAWVGSPDFWADTAGQVDMVVSPRQPGSALKPFLYGLAFDRGYTPATVLADISRTFQTASGPYHPRNYDRRFHGPVRAREALASSYNLPAVEIADKIGFATLLNGLHLAGFTTLDRSAEHYGLGLALGNGDVTLLELANGYRAIANGGLWRPVRWELGAGGAIPTANGAERRVMSARSAALVLNILSDADARVPGFGVSTPFDFPFPVAAKSGTSRHFTDNWSVGATGRFTVAAWAGDFSGRPMEGVSGVSGAGPLLHRAVLLTAARYAPGEFRTPAQTGAIAVPVCRLSGLRATADCPQLIEWFAPGTEPTRLCDWHRDGRIELPAEYTEWLAESGIREGGQGHARGLAAAMETPSSPAPARTPAAAFKIVSPLEGDRYRLPPGVDAQFATLALRATGVPAGTTVQWTIDGHRTQGPRWPLAHGHHTIVAESAASRDIVNIIVE
ncbi:MAG: penicillin-binding protein 1C [Gemmatimonadota bacterium]